jgi:SPP1 family predicted phage head-tail adaptor
MTAGKKRDRITIQRLKTEAEGLAVAASGKFDQTLDSNWTTYATRWAEIFEPSGREYQQEGQVKSETTHIVTIDFDSTTKAITTAMRVRWSDGGTIRLLQILAKPSRRPRAPRRKIEVECKGHA